MVLFSGLPAFPCASMESLNKGRALHPALPCAYEKGKELRRKQKTEHASMATEMTLHKSDTTYERRAGLEVGCKGRVGRSKQL